MISFLPGRVAFFHVAISVTQFVGHCLFKRYSFLAVSVVAMESVGGV